MQPASQLAGRSIKSHVKTARRPVHAHFQQQRALYCLFVLSCAIIRSRLAPGPHCRRFIIILIYGSKCSAGFVLLPLWIGPFQRQLTNVPPPYSKRVKANE